MSDSSEKKQPMNIYLVYVFICTSLVIIYILREYLIYFPINLFIDSIMILLSFGGFALMIGKINWSYGFSIFGLCLFVLWFNKFISSKIKQLFGFEITNGVLTETRKVDEPGVYNIFSDMITAIGNGFIYIASFKFLSSEKDATDTN
jgi:hypothetical protein